MSELKDMPVVTVEQVHRFREEALRQLAAEKAAREKAEADLQAVKSLHSYEQEARKLLEHKLAELGKQEPVPGDYVFCREYDETPHSMVVIGGAYIPANSLEIAEGLSCKLYASPKPPVPDGKVLVDASLLAELEWCDRHFDRHGEPHCPLCGREKYAGEGHDENCALSSALKAAQGDKK